MTRLFIYGTLKRGCSNHRWIKDQDFICEACTEPKFRLFNLGGYPGMISDDNGMSIEGEVWQVSGECLKDLDVLEDVEGGEYALEFIQLLPPNNMEPILSYLYKRPIVDRPLAGTSWKE